MEDAKIVVFGATGYTGGLTARSLVDAGEYPVLAGRSPEKLARLAEDLGGLDYVVADAERPDGRIEALLDPGDVLLTTVGPFLKYGRPALEAAIAAGATYLDSTGEPPFVREVFERHGPRAEGRCALLPAFGYDYVPGNLAGALVVREAGDDAVRVDVGYSTTGVTGVRSASAGTLASIAGVAFEPAFAWRDGRLVTVATADRTRSFRVGEHTWEGMSVGGSEHLALPRTSPHLEEVNVYLSWSGPLSQAMRPAAAAAAALGRLPGVRPASERIGQLIANRAGEGPDLDERARTGSLVVAVAYDRTGREMAEVALEGPNVYDVTAGVLSWGARRATTTGVEATGALGPIEAFGIDALEAGCAEAGLVRVRR